MSMWACAWCDKPPAYWLGFGATCVPPCSAFPEARQGCLMPLCSPPCEQTWHRFAGAERARQDDGAERRRQESENE